MNYEEKKRQLKEKQKLISFFSHYYILSYVTSLKAQFTRAIYEKRQRERECDRFIYIEFFLLFRSGASNVYDAFWGGVLYMHDCQKWLPLLKHRINFKLLEYFREDRFPSLICCRIIINTKNNVFFVKWIRLIKKKSVLYYLHQILLLHYQQIRWYQKKLVIQMMIHHHFIILCI